MKFVIQRVEEASVSVHGKQVGHIKNGCLLLAGVCDEDTLEIAEKMVHKLLSLRIFEDEKGKTNLDIKNVGGELLIISQFTLYADCRKGNRPSFTKAGSADHARKIYEYIFAACQREIDVVEKGIFGEHMKIFLINDGPFTIVLDSDEIIKK